MNARLSLLHTRASVAVAGSAGPILLAARDAVLLAWLALAGPRQRAQVGALMWPERSEALARNSLRQRLFQLRRQCGGVDLLAGNPLLALADGRQWLRDCAAQQVDAAFADSFLQRNPIHAALLALTAAQRPPRCKRGKGQRPARLGSAMNNKAVHDDFTAPDTRPARHGGEAVPLGHYTPAGDDAAHEEGALLGSVGAAALAITVLALASLLLASLHGRRRCGPSAQRAGCRPGLAACRVAAAAGGPRRYSGAD